MAHFVLITRVSDGLPLLESTDPIPLCDSADTCKSQAKAIMKRLSEQGSASRASIDNGNFLFSYLVDSSDNLGLLVMTSSSFPKALIFGFLEELQREFEKYMKATYGEAQWRSQLNTAAQAYAFLGFAKVLARLKREYADPESKSNAARLQGELQDVHNIMRKNIQEVLDRGERLDRECVCVCAVQAC